MDFRLSSSEGSSHSLPYGGNPASTLARAAASNTSKTMERGLICPAKLRLEGYRPLRSRN